MLSQREVNGLVLIDKPKGITSYDVIRRMKKVFREFEIRTKIGHAGTLDPFATGLLVILLGRYTRLSDYIMDASKVYSGCIDLGKRTDTGDLTGRVIESRPVTNEEIIKIIEASSSYTGDFMQIPPQYSALKHEGRPLYEYARKGQFIEKPARPIKVDEFSIFQDEGSLSFRARVSKGTYVRTLVEDYCAQFGVPANLSSLRRESSGSLNVGQACGLEEIKVSTFYDKILSIDDIKTGFEVLDLDDKDRDRLYNGIKISWLGPDRERVLLKTRGRTFALGSVKDGLIRTICFLGER